MQTAFKPSTERLFAGFVDPVDGTCCVPASATAGDIEALVRDHRLRFPLVLDERASLAAQVDASTHAPASSRFGPFCDNILGMNWRLPNGSVVRIGERVAKTTTGYDWLRFLLHSGHRFGSPADYVLRLRPYCGATRLAHLKLDPQQGQTALEALIFNGWMHWWDSVDVLVERERFAVRVAFHTVSEEVECYEQRLREVAAMADGVLAVEDCANAPVDGLPDVVLKTTPDRTLAIARDLAREGLRCVVLYYSGIVHGFAALKGGEPVARAVELGAALADKLEAEGGDWHSRHISSSAPRLAEAAWLQTLEETIMAL